MSLFSFFISENRVEFDLKELGSIDDFLSRLKNKPFLRENWANLFFIIIIAIPFSIFFVQGLLYGFDELEHSALTGLFISAFFYNLFIILIVIFILMNMKLRLTPTLLYLGLIFMVIFFILYLPGMYGGDVNQVVYTGAQCLWEGKNPYDPNELYIQHGSPTGAGVFHEGTYPYLPVDLLSYGLILGIFNLISSFLVNGDVPIWLPGFNDVGLTLANLILTAIGCLFTYFLFPEDRFQGPILALLLMIPFVWSSAPLMMLYAIIGFYFYQSSFKNKEYFVILFFTLSALSKYFAGIFLVAIWITFLYEKEWKKVIAAPGIPIFMFLIVSLPFNFIWVLESTVLFYNSARRHIEDGSLGGTIVAEFARYFDLIDIIGILTLIGLILIFIIGMFIKKNTELRLVVMSLLSLLVINSFAVPFLAIAIFGVILFDYTLITSSQREKSTIMKEEPIESIPESDPLQI
ncbi:MAG: hypothetical protein JSU57_00365 [Candidatus Heimdallarchaeota archaeon]|nr:MAG: hypothetical protein JSU57_00365 [Candidatus Heimdallarchaeota archaeon]